MVGVDECDFLLNTTGSYQTLVPFLDTAEPMTTASPYGPNVYVLAVTDNPHSHRLSQLPVTPNRRYLRFFRSSYLVELVVRPLCHWRLSLGSIPSGSELDQDLDRLAFIRD